MGKVSVALLLLYLKAMALFHPVLSVLAGCGFAVNLKQNGKITHTVPSLACNHSLSFELLSMRFVCFFFSFSSLVLVLLG